MPAVSLRRLDTTSQSWILLLERQPLRRGAFGTGCFFANLAPGQECGNIVLKGQGPAFEITDKPAIALFLSECFLSGRQNPETKKQQLFDMRYEEMSLRIGEEQLLYGQVYVQLLDDQFDTPLFSLNFDMKVREIASQIKIMLQLYMAGNFVDGDEDDTPPFKAPRYR